MSEYIITDKQLERLGIPDMFTECEIVRCMDCKHFKAETSRYPALCRLWLPRNLSKQYGIEPDGFCAWGKRREP